MSEPPRKITKDTTKLEGLRTAVEVVCRLPSIDRLGALAKTERMLSLAGFLAGSMAWIADANFAESAFPKMEVVDEINGHVEKALREIYLAWAITWPHEPKILPQQMQPKEPPPFLG